MLGTSLAEVNSSVLALTGKRVRTSPAPLTNQDSLEQFWVFAVFPGCFNFFLRNVTTLLLANPAYVAVVFKFQ